MKCKKIILSIMFILLFSMFVQGCQKDTEDHAMSGTVSMQEEEDLSDTDSMQEEENLADIQNGQKEDTEEAEDEKSLEVVGCPALQVEGTQLVDSQGNPVQLKGISTHGLAWFPAYVNKDCIRQLREEWNVNVFRLAMYTGESGGYCSGGDKEQLKKLIHDGVSYATELDMYVIIDWHILSDGNPNTYKDEAKAFFTEMAQTYAEHTNVIYEICNEPNGGTSWAEVKAYAEEVIPVIRKYDEDAVIIVGTPNWCQYVDQAAADPITGYDNIMYALHFYAATHTDYLRNTMTAAIDAGLPIFVSEYGICDASGNGGIDEYQANEWVKTMNRYNVSYVAWNLSNKNETSAMINSGCNKTADFSMEDLSACGKWVYEMLTGKSSSQLQPKPEQEAENSSSVEIQTTPVPVVNIISNGDIAYSAEVANSWESSGKMFYQYNLTIQNEGEADCTDWSLILEFSDDIAFSEGWNGNYLPQGKKLQVSSMDYNSKIPAGGSIKDIGFIVSGPSGFTLVQ